MSELQIVGLLLICAASWAAGYFGGRASAFMRGRRIQVDEYDEVLRERGIGFRDDIGFWHWNDKLASRVSSESYSSGWTAGYEACNRGVTTTALKRGLASLDVHGYLVWKAKEEVAADVARDEMLARQSQERSQQRLQQFREEFASAAAEIED